MSLMQRQMPALGEVRPMNPQTQRQAPQLPSGNTVVVPSRGPSLPVPGTR
ncbi:hypothetical protein [Solimonas sp. K1W22B-7]|nr:hypothetical protein [Solimonas sp. K1W22B-7]